MHSWLFVTLASFLMWFGDLASPVKCSPVVRSVGEGDFRNKRHPVDSIRIERNKEPVSELEL